MKSNQRWTVASVFLTPGVFWGIGVLRMAASNPTTGTMSPNSPPLSWTGTAAGGAYNGESTCVEAINCDTFTLTVTGTPSDWSNKRIQIAMSWLILANDYDIYIH